MRRLLKKLVYNRPVRIINLRSDGSPYLERYFLFSFLGWTGYIHRFRGSDIELHDHPWSYAFSIVLSGWYIEERLVEFNATGHRIRRRPIKFFNSIRGNDFHQVVVPSGMREVWTLFVHKTRRHKCWGFLNFHHDDRSFIYTEHPNSAPGWWKTAPSLKARAKL